MNQEIKTKKCIKCLQVKSINAFYYRKQRKSYRNDCIICTNNHRKKYYIQNKNKELNKNKEWWLQHKIVRDLQKREYYRKNSRKLSIQNILYAKVRYHGDPIFRQRTNIRRRILQETSDRNVQKCRKTISLLGNTISDFNYWIELQWYKNMIWNSRGKGFGCWQIHHICPIEFFDLSDPIEQQQAFHYTNTKPLWYEDHCGEHRKINERMSQYDPKDIFPWKFK